ncbi:hypothetical protein SETIT_7G145700v2 [Setaria italica]|uniref:F-box domain-containing protein n=1 Tax=Setaria italica TaxID=4555 RepID=A0A368RVX7_SETIT|nr:hypothetical protein SETIT_7G145700v2 [Setaria italica]
METELMAIPDDALADALRRLPAESLAAARCVCKAWRGAVDDRGLLLPHLLPHSVRGIFINYIEHKRPHLFAHPSPTSPPARPKIDAMLSFLPNDTKDAWSVMDHCDGLLLCDINRGRQLCVCNPATQRWTLLPPRGAEGLLGCAGEHLVFDAAVSPHYEVVLIPALPQEPVRKKQRRELPWHQEVRVPASFEVEWTVPPLPPRPPSVRTPDEDKEADDDPYRLMEWPPTPWQVSVFSSRTGQWEDRSFVREGEPAGTVWSMRRRCAVYRQGALYVHCQATTNIANVKPCLGRSGKDVCFGIVDGAQLRVWILRESCEKMVWNLRYQGNLSFYIHYLGSLYDNNNSPIRGPWIVEEDNGFEWDSDDDDVVSVDSIGEEEEVFWGDFSHILGFHPYKEVAFLAEPLGAVAYHMNTSKAQYLGNSRPDCYFHNSSNGIYESFVYTPCTIGELQEGNVDQNW